MSVGYSRRTRRRSSRSAATRLAMQLLQLGLHAVLGQAGVVAELDDVVVQHLVELDGERLARRGWSATSRPSLLADVHGGFIQLSGL